MRGLSKTVVSVIDGTVDSLPQGSELASGYQHETLRNHNFISYYRFYDEEKNIIITPAIIITDIIM